MQVWSQFKFDPNCISMQSAIKSSDVISASSRNSADVISDSTDCRLHNASQYGLGPCRNRKIPSAVVFFCPIPQPTNPTNANTVHLLDFTVRAPRVSRTAHPGGAGPGGVKTNCTAALAVYACNEHSLSETQEIQGASLQCAARYSLAGRRSTRSKRLSPQRPASPRSRAPYRG